MPSPARRRLRVAMTVSTALTGGLVAGTAGAQVTLPPVTPPPVTVPPVTLPPVTLPPPSSVITEATAPGGALDNAVVTGVGNNLQVALKGTSTVLTWNNGFNIPSNGSINFADARVVGQGTQQAVLNRDVTGNASQLLGSLTSSKNIAVWVYNPNGIVVGPGARINTGSLVLTTLAVDSSEFLSGSSRQGTSDTASYHLVGAAGGHSITVQAGANITVTSGNRGLVMVAPQIIADGTFNASGTGGTTPQDVAFVVANDVTVNYAANSPLSVTLNKGTAFGGSTTQVVRGSVAGRSALFAIASQGSVTDALLGVDATVTTASATGRGIVLSAGNPVTPVSGVTVAGTSADTGGIAGLSVTRSLTSARQVLIGANGSVNIPAAITAATDYQVAGASVTLGGAGNVTQAANGSVSITATGGSITGADGLKLQSAADGSGSEQLSLATSGASGGDINFAAGTRLLAGNNRNADLQIRLRDASNNLTLGNVAASAIRGAVGSAALADNLAIGGAMTLGSVSLRTALALSANGISTGDVSADLGITLISSAGLAASSLTASGGAVSLGGGAGVTSVTGAVRAQSNVTIARGGAVSLGSINAGSAVTIGSDATPAASLLVSGTTTGRNISVVTGGQQQYGDAITAAGTLTLNAGGAISLPGATAVRDLLIRGASVTAPEVASSAGAVQLSATAGNVQALHLRAAGDIAVDATGTAAVTGGVTAGGAFRVSGGGVTLGTAGASVTQAAGGAVQISAGAGGIAGLGALTLLANGDGKGAETLGLTVSDPMGGIVFDPASSLLGGQAQQSDIAIRSGASAPLSLGTVSARTLLGATGSDPLAIGLVRDGAMSFGDVGVAGPLVLRGAGITAGALGSGDAVTLGGAGLITVASITGAGPVQLTGTGDTTVTGLVRATGANGSVAVDRSGAVRLGGLAASGNVALGTVVAPSSITVAGNPVIGGALTAISTGAQRWGGAIRANAVALSGLTLALSDITATGGDLSLTSSTGDVTTGALTASGTVRAQSAAMLTAGAVTGGAVALSAAGALDAGVTRATLGNLTASGGSVRLAGVGAAGNLALTTGSGGFTFNTPLTAGGSVSVSAPGDVSFNGVTAGGALQVDTGGVASLAGAVSAGSLQLFGASVVLGAGARITSAGTIDLRAATGGITGASGLFLGSTGSDPAQFVRLQAGGAAGIAFDANSRIDAPALRVAVRMNDPAANLVLGNVSAGSLVGLTVLDGDPRLQAGVISAAAPVFGALTLAGEFRARATVGDLTLGSLDVSGAGQGIDLSAAGALRVGASVRADGDVRLAAATPLSLASATSGSGRVTVASGGALTVGTLAGATGISASGTSLDIGTITGGAATLTASAGALRLGGGTVSAATLRSTGGGTAVTGDLAVTGALTLTSGTDALLGGRVRAGSAGVTADAVRIADLGTIGATTITARTGDVGGVAAGGGATLSAGDLSVTAPGAVRLASGAAHGALSVNAGSIALTGASAGGDLRLSATGGAQVAGPVTVGGNYALTAGSVTLDGVQSAGGAVTVATRAGALTGRSGLVLTSDTLGTGTSPLTLTAVGGALALDPASTLNGGLARQSTVVVDSGANALTLGAVNARALLVNGGKRTEAAIATGALSLTDSLTILGGAGGVRTGAVSVAAGDATLDAGAGALSVGVLGASGAVRLTGARVDHATVTAGSVTENVGALGLTGGAITAAGPVAISSGGTLDVAGVTTTGAGGNVSIASQGAARLGAVQASGGASVATLGTASDLVLVGGLTAVGDVQVASTRDIRSPFITSTTGKLTVSAPNGSATGLNPGDVVSLSAGDGSAFSVTVGGDVRLGALTGGPVSLAARSITATSIDVGTNLINLAATGGDLSIAGMVRGGAVSLTATGTTTLGGPLTASGAVQLAGMRGLAFGDVTGTSVSALSNGQITGGTVTGGLVAVTGGSVALTRVASTGAATLAANAGDLTLGSANTGGDFSANATGALSLEGAVTAGGALKLSGARVLTVGDLTGASVSATSAGAITGGTLTGGTVAVTGGSVALTRVASTGAATLVANAGDLTLGSASTGGDFIASSTGLLSLPGAVSAGGAAQLTGARGVTFADLSGGAVGITSSGAITGATLTASITSVAGASVALTRVTAAGAAMLAASAGDLTLGGASTGGDLGASASGTVTIPGAVTAGGAYLVRGGAVALGATGVTQAVRGRVDITATTGGITGANGLTLVSDSAGGSAGNSLVLDSAGGIAMAGTLVQAGPGGGAALGLRAGAGQAVTLGRVEAASVGGVDAGHGDFGQPFTHAGSTTLGDINAGRVAIALTAGDLRVGKVTATGGVTLAAAGALGTGAISAGMVDLSAGGALSGGDVVAAGSAKVAGGDVTLASLTASGDLSATARGTLNIGTASARGAASLTGTSVAVDSASGSTLAITTAGDVTGRAGGRAALASTGGDLSVDAGGQARLQSMASAGSVSLTGGTVDVAGQLSAARALLVKARQALTLGGAASAGNDATLTAGGAATLDALGAGGAVSVSSAGLTARSVSAGGTMALTSTGDLTLGQGQAGGAATIDAGGLATLGQVVAGPSLSILASDAELNGTQRAAAVTITNRAAATRTLRLGDATANDGFRLSGTELGRIDTATLTLDGGTGAVELGTAAFGAAVGSKAVQVFSTGQVSITGAVTGGGAGRSFTIGGAASSPTSNAASIQIAATSSGGGRLLLPDADVELRGDRIAAGLATGFLDTLAASGAAGATNLVNNANSSLYNANLGGGFYGQSNGTLLSARSLTVRYGDYALFQNTGLPGTSAGVVLGGSMTSPVAPALTLLPTGSGTQNSLALFGTINGIGQTAAALLGPDVVAVNGANRASTRINGCLVGSGAGCLSTVTIQPTLQVFHVTASEVFGAAEDLTVPFDPVIGGGNEELLTGLDLLALESASVSTPPPPPVVEARP